MLLANAGNLHNSGEAGIVPLGSVSPLFLNCKIFIFYNLSAFSNSLVRWKEV